VDPRGKQLVRRVSPAQHHAFSWSVARTSRRIWRNPHVHRADRRIAKLGQRAPQLVHVDRPVVGRGQPGPAEQRRQVETHTPKAGRVAGSRPPGRIVPRRAPRPSRDDRSHGHRAVAVAGSARRRSGRTARAPGRGGLGQRLDRRRGASPTRALTAAGAYSASTRARSSGQPTASRARKRSSASPFAAPATWMIARREGAPFGRRPHQDHPRRATAALSLA